MIKVFKAHPMRFTPFSEKDCLEFLEKQGIYFTDNPQDCDIVVSITFRTLYKYILQNITKGSLTKKYLIWTHESRDNTCFKPKINEISLLPTIHIMNIYTGDIWFNNYYEDNSGKSMAISQFLEMLTEENFPDFKHRKIAALMIYRNDQKKWSLKRNNQELDLCYLRTQIALTGYNLNKIDIYGAGWPEGISLEVSRSWNGKWTIPRESPTGIWRGWSDRKEEILQNYHFNLCFENTNLDFYCTEKIWDSIRLYCLPIYYGEGNKIYEDFPRNSFLDYCEFKNTKALLEYIDQMSVEEFRHRLNLCIEVFNKVWENQEYHKPQNGTTINEARLLRIIDKIKQIVDQ